MVIAFINCSHRVLLPETGSIDIKVTIGPLCPVEPCNKTAAELKAIYESYSFVISNPTSKAVILEQKLTHNGTNGVMKSTDIVVGEYELNIKPENIFTKRGFPKTIKIEKNKTTSIEIDIDTGLR
jgi:hypothetical protein